MEESFRLEGTDIKTKEELLEAIKTNKEQHAKTTEEEFNNFMHRVTQVEKIVKKLNSEDEYEQKHGMALADEILHGNTTTELTEIGELKVKSNRTIINKIKPEDSDPNTMSQETFKRYVTKDADERYENRKIRNERADTYKRIGNNAFKQENWEKAVTYFTKAVEQRKDSTLLWNNRALSYMKLGLYEKALTDCDWALRLNEDNLKALLNSAKCHMMMNNEEKSREFIELAKERNPEYLKYITEFEKNLRSQT